MQKYIFFFFLLLGYFWLSPSIYPVSTDVSSPQQANSAEQVSSFIEEKKRAYFPTNSVLTIDPKARALDYQQAFAILRKEKSAANIYFQLSDGSIIANIMDMVLISNGTLLLFKCNSSEGIKFHVSEIERIVGINHY